MTLQDMKKRLENNIPGSEVEVVDLTGTEDHWEVRISSSKFQNMSRIQQHQFVMEQFRPELKTGEVHALSIITKVK